MNSILPPGAPDPNEQQRKAADPRASVWVSASAGSGKTKVLTDRVLTLLLTGSAPERVLCITFTKAAAAEMSNRISAQLGKWSTLPDNAALIADLTKLLGRAPTDAEQIRARRLFATVLDTPGGMKIQTVHAFCQSVLQRFPLEAGISPNFVVLDERDARVLLKSAIDDLIALAGSGGDPALGEAMAVLTRRTHETTFPDLISALMGERGRIARILERHADASSLHDAVCDVLGLDPAVTPAQLEQQFCASTSFDDAGLRRALDVLDQGGKTDQKNQPVLARWLSADPVARRSMIDDYLGIYLTGKDEIRAKLCTKAVETLAPGTGDILYVEAVRCEAFLEARKALTVAEATLSLLTLADRLSTRYARMKALRNVLDYDDLILKTRDLLAVEGNVGWVLFKLDRGIDHVLVDEAQDTNPEQWEVIERLTGEFFVGESAHERPPTVFAVGDGKQSIYSFQRADPREFVRMRERFKTKATAAERNWAEVPLQMSFRSTTSVLAAVDHTFASPAVSDGVAIGESEIRHYAWRSGHAGLVELWPPVEPDVTDDPPAWKPPLEAQLGESAPARVAGLIADDIAGRITRGEMLASRGRPLRASDFLVLVRTRGLFVEHLVRALKARDVEIAGVDRMILKEQIAVMDLVALGRFLLLPEDDLNLACLLKSPLIGLTEDELFEVAWNRPARLWDALRDSSLPNAVAATRWLHDLLAQADYIRPFELYERVLDGDGGRKKFLGRLGQDCADPINEFINLCLNFERSNTPSLQGFLHWFETGDVEIKRDPESGESDAVRIMTVHGAKGLQAPVVYLPDTLQAPSRGALIQWDPDKEGGGMPLWSPQAPLDSAEVKRRKELGKVMRDAEYRRLLYVAMTRAEDRLYICGWKNRQKEPEGCWYNLILNGLEGNAAEITDARFETPILRLENDQTREPSTEQHDLTETRILPLPDWALRSAPIDPEPSDPLSPSRPDEEDPPVRSPLTDGDNRDRFLRGKLVHRMLQSLPDIDPARRGDVGAAYLAQPGHRLSESQQEAILTETLAVMTRPDFADLFTGAAVAEAPIVGTVQTQAGPRVVSGQIDRIVITDDRVLVVDYKTNRPPPTDAADVPMIYLRQMALYRRLLMTIYPGKTVDCALLWTDGPILMRLPVESMERAAP